MAAMRHRKRQSTLMREFGMRRGRKARSFVEAAKQRLGSFMRNLYQENFMRAVRGEN